MALETLTDAQQRLGQAGFTADLVADGTNLKNAATGETHDPATLRAAEVIRFEGASDPGDEAILVAVAQRDGAPIGTFVCPYGPSASVAEGEILQHLHRIVADDEHLEHDTHEHLGAIFPDHASAEAAIADLREIGLGSEHLGIAVHQADPVIFEYDEEAQMAHSIGKGAVVGSVVGFLGGMLIFGLAGGPFAAGGIAALGAGSVPGGGMIGGYAALFAGTEDYDTHAELRHTRLEPGEILVVVCAHEHPHSVNDAFERHAGRLVDVTPKQQ